MTDNRKPTFEDAIADPRNAFRDPYEVVAHAQYSAAEKKKILESWRADEEELISAADEGMADGEQNMLPDVLEAMRLLIEGAGGSNSK